MPTIEIDGLRFSVAIDGPETAPVLMLSNSLSSDMTMWEDQLPALVQHFRIVRYDQRGHGGTQVSERPYGMDRLALDAIAILDALSIEKAHWCGVSMGGMTGMRALTHHRHRIGRAVLANTAAHMGPPSLWNGRIATANRGGMAALVDATIQRWFKPDFIARGGEPLARMRSMILNTPVGGYTGCCAAIRDMDQREAIRSITNPVLVIIGGHDPATTPRAGDLVHGAIRGSKCLTLDAAHISNVEQPAAFTKALIEFLEAKS